jgi:NAD(P)-dependent dehydrogenase (short-subunit alcohol dehydrogenase family)
MNFFVTGGSRGLGRQLVMDIVAAGHSVAFTYRSDPDAASSVEAAAKALAPDCRCLAFHLDQREVDEVDDVSARVIDEMGTIDALVCNAGINRRELLVSLSDEDWHDVIATNLTGPFLLSRAILPHFLAARRGRAIFVSSIAMHGGAGLASYAASKAGLVGLSGTIAREYGRRGVTSNVLMLGVLGGEGMAARDTTPEFTERWRDMCPTGREAHLNEVSGIVLYLASDGAAFVNGQTIGVTGGLDVLL